MIWLTGFMGSGKSSVGRELGRRLGLALVDTDREVEVETGRAIPEIFAELGEEAFRRVEARILAACAERDDAVIATGGGVVESPANVDLMLASGRVVFLDCDFELLRRRVAGSRQRPLFQDVEAARARYARRRPAYERCHLRLTTEARDRPVDVAERIRLWLESECAT